MALDEWVAHAVPRRGFCVYGLDANCDVYAELNAMGGQDAQGASRSRALLEACRGAGLTPYSAEIARPCRATQDSRELD